MLQLARLQYKVKFKFKNRIFQSLQEHTYENKSAEQFENHIEPSNICLTSAEESQQSARYFSLLSKLRRLLTQCRHNHLTDFTRKFL